MSRLLPQVPGVSTTRFFVPSKGVTHQWTAKEMASHDDFVYLDMSATYQTIGSQVVMVWGQDHGRGWGWGQGSELWVWVRAQVRVLTWDEGWG